MTHLSNSHFPIFIPFHVKEHKSKLNIQPYVIVTNLCFKMSLTRSLKYLSNNMHSCIVIDNIQAIKNRKSKQKRRVVDVNSHTYSTKINCHKLKLTILTHSILRREKVIKAMAKYVISIANV